MTEQMEDGGPHYQFHVFDCPTCGTKVITDNLDRPCMVCLFTIIEPKNEDVVDAFIKSL